MGCSPQSLLSQRQLSSRDQYSAYHSHSKNNGKSRVVRDIKGQNVEPKPQIVYLQNSKHWKSVNIPSRNIRKNSKILITSWEFRKQHGRIASILVSKNGDLKHVCKLVFLNLGFFIFKSQDMNKQPSCHI